MPAKKINMVVWVALLGIIVVMGLSSGYAVYVVNTLKRLAGIVSTTTSK